jgi:hypothetical protein
VRGSELVNNGSSHTPPPLGQPCVLKATSILARSGIRAVAAPACIGAAEQGILIFALDDPA